VQIDFDHFDKASTIVPSIGEWLVIAADGYPLDMLRQLPAGAICRCPIAARPARRERLRLRPIEAQKPVDRIAACPDYGDARGDDPGR
jgi:hypothetical protein